MPWKAYNVVVQEGYAKESEKAVGEGELVVGWGMRTSAKVEVGRPEMGQCMCMKAYHL